MKRVLLSSMLGVATLMTACGGDKACSVDDPGSCADNQVCEQVQGQAQPACFAPIEVHGKVFDLGSNQGIGQARVTAVDVDGAPLGTVAVTAGDGTYSLRIPSERQDKQGTPVGRTLALRAAARDFQNFPSGPRVALPLDSSKATAAKEGDPRVLSGGPSDIGLVPLPAGERGFPAIFGKADLQNGQSSVLVVAEAPGQVGRTAIADGLGQFVIFNVPPGMWNVRGFTRGVNYTPSPVEVQSGKDRTDVQLLRSGTQTGTVQGTVQMVSTTGLTSVVLVVASTFNENLERGEVPPGLRAPSPGTAPNINGAYQIEGVPDGDYVVLAAFENDGLVRDPNTNTSGTAIQRVSVVNGVANRDAAFKVTDAIQLSAPGAGDEVEKTGATPTFSWMKYASAKSYQVLLFDTFGNEVWHSPDGSLGQDATSIVYNGAPLQSGRIYQWRALAFGQAGQTISLTEDLKGIFEVE
jgi:hypothetical protein